MYPNCVKNVIECLKDLPGIGEKTAERLAFSMIDFDEEKLTYFSQAICDVRDKITRCSICGNISDEDICSICSNNNRNSSVLFVVEKPKDTEINKYIM